MNEISILFISASVILWAMYSAFEGYAEGYYWHYRTISNQYGKGDLHWAFVLRRGICALGLVSMAMFHSESLISGMFILLHTIFAFSFYHNGAYYLTRNKLNDKIYQGGFKDHNDSDAVMDIDYRMRLIMFVISIVFIYLAYRF